MGHGPAPVEGAPGPLHPDRRGPAQLNWRNEAEMEKLSDTLKNVMQQRDWPVRLIVGGLPELADFLQRDGQLRRRSHVVHLKNLKFPRDAKLLGWLAATIVRDHAGMEFGFEVSDEFLARLCRASWNQFGIVTQIVRGAVEQALLEDRPQTEVTARHFARSYAAFSGCQPSENIMTAANWTRSSRRTRCSGTPRTGRRTSRPRDRVAAARGRREVPDEQARHHRAPERGRNRRQRRLEARARERPGQRARLLPRPRPPLPGDRGRRRGRHARSRGPGGPRPRRPAVVVVPEGRGRVRPPRPAAAEVLAPAGHGDGLPALPLGGHGQ